MNRVHEYNLLNDRALDSLGIQQYREWRALCMAWMSIKIDDADLAWMKDHLESLENGGTLWEEL